MSSRTPRSRQSLGAYMSPRALLMQQQRDKMGAPGSAAGGVTPRSRRSVGAAPMSARNGAAITPRTPRQQAGGALPRPGVTPRQNGPTTPRQQATPRQGATPRQTPRTPGSTRRAIGQVPPSPSRKSAGPTMSPSLSVGRQSIGNAVSPASALFRRELAKSAASPRPPARRSMGANAPSPVPKPRLPNPDPPEVVERKTSPMSVDAPSENSSNNSTIGSVGSSQSSTVSMMDTTTEHTTYRMVFAPGSNEPRQARSVPAPEFAAIRSKRKALEAVQRVRRPPAEKIMKSMTMKRGDLKSAHRQSSHDEGDDFKEAARRVARELHRTRHSVGNGLLLDGVIARRRAKSVVETQISMPNQDAPSARTEAPGSEVPSARRFTEPAIQPIGIGRTTSEAQDLKLSMLSGFNKAHSRGPRRDSVLSEMSMRGDTLDSNRWNTMDSNSFRTVNPYM